MSNFTQFTLILILYLGLTTYIGVFAYKKYQPRDLEGYLLGGRGINWVVLLFTLAATQFSALSFMGFLGFWYKFGVPAYTAIATGMYFILSVGTWFLAPRIWKLGKQRGHFSGGNLLSDYYDSKLLGLIYAVLMIIAVIPYLQVQMAGVGYLLQVGSGGVLPFWVGAALVYVIIMIYTFLGGMHAVAFTDVVQGVFMVVGIMAAAIGLVYVAGGSIAGVFGKIAATSPQLLTVPGAGRVFNWTYLVSWTIPVGLGWITHPHMWVRAYIGKDIRTTRLTPLFALGFSFIIYTFGLMSAMVGLITLPGLKAPDTVLVAAIAKFFPAIFLALIASAGVAAMMSSLDSQLLGLTNTVIKDIIHNINPETSNKNLFRYAHWSVLFFGLLGLILVFVNPGLLTAIGALSAVIGVQALPGLLLALFNVRWASKEGVLAGITGGFIGVLLFNFYPPLKNYLGIYAGSWGLIINLASLGIVSLATNRISRPSEAKINAFSEIGW